MGLFDKVGDMAKEHQDKVNDGIEKVGDVVDEKTGGKYADKVDQAQDFARDQFGKLAGDKAADDPVTPPAEEPQP